MAKTFNFDTLSLHAEQHPDETTDARATPIYQTASYVFKSPDHAAAIFNVERTGHVYSRISNPTNAVLEERIAALEGGVGAIATASGQAACFLGISTIVSAGEHIVASRSLYGGTHNLLEYTLPRFGIEITFIDPRDPQAFATAIQPNTRLVFGEVLGNGGLGGRGHGRNRHRRSRAGGAWHGIPGGFRYRPQISGPGALLMSGG